MSLTLQIILNQQKVLDQMKYFPHFQQRIKKIIFPITRINNPLLETDIFPDGLKGTKVIPIYKASNPSQIHKYRQRSIMGSLLYFPDIGDASTLANANIFSNLQMI